MKISTIIQQQQQPGIKMEQIQPFMEGLIGILPIHTSKLATLLREPSHESAYAYVETVQKLFKQKDFYIGFQDHGLASEQSLHHSNKAFNNTFQLLIVTIHDFQYINKLDAIT